jgi:hypothetical protein
MANIIVAKSGHQPHQFSGKKKPAPWERAWGVTRAV